MASKLPTKEQIENMFLDEQKVFAAMLKSAGDNGSNTEDISIGDLKDVSNNIKNLMLELIKE